MATVFDFAMMQIIFLTSLFIITKSNNTQPKIYNILPTGSYADDDEPFRDAPPILPSDVFIEMYVYGEYLSTDLEIGIIDEDSDCEYMAEAQITSILDTDGKLGIMHFDTPLLDSYTGNYLYHFCILDPILNEWVFQGSQNSVSFLVYTPWLPPSFLIILIILCFCLSALMSGLNIGLMALNPQELELLKKIGTEKEKKYVQKIIPVRIKGNFLLCSILITSTLCNAISTVLIDKFVPSEITVICTTIIIVLFCEIVPQIVCRYFPLSISANTIYIIKSCMALTAPISYPLSLILNFILKKEITAVYTKERLKELLKMTELPMNEGKIIEGTLDLSQKKVEDVMTPLDDIFKLPVSGVMNFEIVKLILASGFSRIPIYVENEADIRYILLTKNLALLDPDDNIPISVLVEHSNVKCKYIPFGTTLDSALGMFKDSRRHMAFVVDNTFSANNEEKKVLGLITFEDVLEELFQAEINDETDAVVDNRGNHRLLDNLRARGLLSFMHQTHTTHSTETPSENLRLAAFHFLSGIDVFSVEHVSRNVLLKLLRLDSIYCTTHGPIQSYSESIFIKGVPADYFVMILEGKTNVEVGDEGLTFEAGPFKYFGLEALKKVLSTSESLDFKPNFTLQAKKKMMYLKIPVVLYKAALLATNYERLNEVPDISIKSDLYKYFDLLVDYSSRPSEQNK